MTTLPQVFPAPQTGIGGVGLLEAEGFIEDRAHPGRQRIPQIGDRADVNAPHGHRLHQDRACVDVPAEAGEHAQEGHLAARTHGR